MESEQLSDSREVDVVCCAAVRGRAGAAEHAATLVMIKAVARTVKCARTLSA
jgi:hypothetical protein